MPEVAPVPPPVAPAPAQKDPAKLEGEINRALRSAGLASITAQVDDDLLAVLSGTATSAEDKRRAFQVARGFGDIKSFKDRIFVVE